MWLVTSVEVKDTEGTRVEADGGMDYQGARALLKADK